MTNKPCIHELRGEEARCNGGGYNGCACGWYTQADQKALKQIERRELARKGTERRINRLRAEAAELNHEANRLEKIIKR